MCTTIEFDMDEDTLHSMVGLMRTRLEEICDECSMSIFDEYDITSIKNLNKVVGKVMFNSLIVESIQAQIEIDLLD